VSGGRAAILVLRGSFFQAAPAASPSVRAEENSLMTGPNYTIHARARVLELFEENDVDRLAQQACDAAAKSQGWGPGEEFIFEIKDELYSIPGIEPSVLIVCHKGDMYEIFGSSDFRVGKKRG
jgi:hypothetical protein